MSQLYEYIKMAFFNILSNKIRSFLTMLGIIIGISSVILIMSIGNGAKETITSQLDSIGSGQIAIVVNDYNYTITKDDILYIEDNVDGIKAIQLNDSLPGKVSTQKGDFDAYAYGCTENNYLFESYSIISKGRYFNKDEYQAGKLVCYISAEDAIKLYGTTDVLGMPIEINVNGRIVEYTIIGITSFEEGNTLVSYSYSDAPIYLNVPLTTFEYSLGYASDEYYGIYFIPEDNVDSKAICDKVINVLESRHNCKGEDIFRVQSFSDYLSTINTVINMITLFISLVAAISLFVGGVGVMNIMLVSVTERTREIGIRKALGAKTGSIMLQFLSESAIIAMLGGILGILSGLIGASIICGIISMLSPTYAFTPSISGSAVILTTLFSSAVGIFFGIYPAKKAAKLSPIEALRRI